jgi:PBP1b-binding outer membrane lipoprotein LpoB
MKKVEMAVVYLAMVLNGCASGHGDADAGPDPGGGFYDGPNFNVER